MVYNENKLSLYRLLTYAGISLSLVTAVWSIVMYGTFYDAERHFFNSGIPLIVLQILCLLTPILALVGLVCLRPQKVHCSGTLPALSSAEALLSALCGFFLLATVIMQFIYGISGLDVGKYDVSRSALLLFFTGGGEALLGQTFQSLALLVALPSSFFFLYPAFTEKPRVSIRSAFGLFFLLWTALCVLVTNFQMDIPMNSPERLGPMLAFTSMMLFAVAEQRFLYGRGKLGFLYASGILTMFFAFSDGLSTLLYSFAGRFDMGVPTIYACVELSLALYAAVRLLSFARLPLLQSREDYDRSLLSAAKDAAGGKHELIPAPGPKPEIDKMEKKAAEEKAASETAFSAASSETSSGSMPQTETASADATNHSAHPRAARKPRL